MTANVIPFSQFDPGALRLPEPPPKRRQIFVNRDLRLDHIAHIGFDMDYTLAVYRREPMEALAHRLTVDKLVNKRGYDPAILSMRYDPKFVIRGLIVDKQLGNIIKIDRHNHVGRGYHGRRVMDKEARRQVYRNESVRLSNPRYYLVDTLFALPEVCLLADLIDFLEGKGEKVDYEKLFTDIRNCIDEAHQDDSLKGVIIDNPGAYVERDDELAHTLHKLRSSGKKLMLITNSLWAYTDPLMRFLLDGQLPQYPSWRNYFDVVVVGARKPTWFTGDAKFIELNVDQVAQASLAGPIDKAVERLQKGRVYQGGNMRELERMAGISGDDALYVGDHIYGDILKTKKSGSWRTALVVSELEDEIALHERFSAKLEEQHVMEGRRRVIDEELLYSKSMLSSLERVIDTLDVVTHKTERDRLIALAKDVRRDRDEMKKVLQGTLQVIDAVTRDIEEQSNPYWGQVFKEGPENTRFGAQVSDYACVYTSRVSNFFAYSPLQYFRAPRALMSHER